MQRKQCLYRRKSDSNCSLIPSFLTSPLTFEIPVFPLLSNRSSNGCILPCLLPAPATNRGTQRSPGLDDSLQSTVISMVRGGHWQLIHLSLSTFFIHVSKLAHVNEREREKRLCIPCPKNRGTKHFVSWWIWPREELILKRAHNIASAFGCLVPWHLWSHYEQSLE